MKYYVIKHDYGKRSTNVERVFNSLHNSTNYLEEQVFGYLTQHVGKDFEIHKEHHFNSRYWGTAPYGYLMMKNDRESIYKITILLKKKTWSLLFDSYEIEPLYYYEIVRNETQEFVACTCEEQIFDSDEEDFIMDIEDVKNKVLKELLEKTKIHNGCELKPNDQKKT